MLYTLDQVRKVSFALESLIVGRVVLHRFKLLY